VKQENRPAAVYCINPKYDIQNDYRLTFLKVQGVVVESIYDAFSQKLNMLHHAMRFLYLWVFAKAKRLNSDNQENRLLLLLSRWGQLIIEWIGHKLYKLTRKIFYNKNWARYILEHSRAQVLCFDHIIHNQYVVAVLLRAAKEMSIPTIAFPMESTYIPTNLLSPNRRRSNDFLNLIVSIMSLCKTNYARMFSPALVLAKTRSLYSEAPDFVKSG